MQALDLGRAMGGALAIFGLAKLASHGLLRWDRKARITDPRLIDTVAVDGWLRLSEAFPLGLRGDRACQQFAALHATGHVRRDGDVTWISVEGAERLIGGGK